MTEPLSLLILFAVGAIAGALNVIAGGGSFLSLPVLIFLGLPPSVANGTNRVAILIQNAGAVWGFHRYRVMDWRFAAATLVPAVVGALGGTWLALVIGEAAFQRSLAVLMVAISLFTLWDPRRHRHGDAPEGFAATPAQRLLFALGFFVIGVYGGFVQAGAGFLILAATTLAGLDLVRGNALKALIILAFTPLSLAIFAANGKVVWSVGLVLAAGNLAGGMLGVRMTVLRGHRWVKAVVTIAVIAFAIKLWLAP